MSPDRASSPHDEPPTLLRRRPAATERRSTARLPIEMDVLLEGAAHRFAATTGDLSSGGMFVLTERVIPVGTEVVLEFTLPNGQSLEVLGEVRWQHDGSSNDRSGDGESERARPRGPGLGLSFFCLEPASKAALGRFCDLREALYYR